MAELRSAVLLAALTVGLIPTCVQAQYPAMVAGQASRTWPIYGSAPGSVPADGPYGATAPGGLAPQGPPMTRTHPLLPGT